MADLNSMTREQLIERATLLQQAKAIQARSAGPVAPAGPEPGSHPDAPVPTDLYGDDAVRAKAGFGNAEGLAPILKARGASDVQRNKAGDIVAKGADGKWYKDADNFFPDSKQAPAPSGDESAIDKLTRMAGTMHPVNWLESALGKSLPTGGMMLGGAGAGAVATPESLGAATIPAAVAGASAGSAAGELLRQKIGQKLGVQSGTDWGDVGGEAVTGALGELAGRGVGKAAESFARSGMGGAVKDATAFASSKLSGVPQDAARRLLERPDQVNNPRPYLDVARDLGTEARGTLRDASDKLMDATANFDATVGSQKVDTRPLVEKSRQSIERVAPSADTGQGLLEPKEQRELTKWAKNAYITPPDPVQYQPFEYRPGVAGRETVPGQPVEFSPYTPGEAYQQTLTNLRKSAQDAGDEVSRAFEPQNNIPAKRSGPYVGYMKNAYGDIKDVIRPYDENFANVQSDWHDKAKAMNLLGPSLKEGSRENFVTGLGSREGKTEQLEAAKTMAPKVYEDLMDMRAGNAFDNASPKIPGLGITPRTALSLGLSGAGALGSYSTGSEKPLIAGTMLGAAISPAMHRRALTMAAKGAVPIIRRGAGLLTKEELDGLLNFNPGGK